MVKGLAHITGGGLVDNLPRVLPKDCDAVIETRSWKMPAIFRCSSGRGKCERAEMYQVFNMGIGMAIIVAPKNAAEPSGTGRGRNASARIERGLGL